MNTQALLSLGSDFPEALAAGLRSPQMPGLLDGDDGKRIVASLRRLLKRGDENSALRIAAAAIGLTRGAALLDIRFAENFRPTTFDEDLAVLAVLERVLAQLRGACSIHTSLSATVSCLRSWANYAELYRRSRDDERQIIGEFRRHSTVLATSSLTLAEHSFAKPPSTPAHALRRSFADLTREEVASGASYALEACAKFARLSYANMGRFTNAVPCSTFKPAVFRAYQLREVLDAEADIFRAQYTCEKSGSDSRPTFEILPPNERFGQALGFGYWLHSVMPVKHQVISSDSRALTLNAVIRAWIERMNEKLAAFEGPSGQRRLVMRFPLQLLVAFGKEFIAPDKLFAEEVSEMRVAAMELQWPLDKLLDFELAPALRVFDVLKIHRFLRLLACSRMACLDDAGVSTLDYWNSLVAGFTMEDLRGALSSVGLPSPAVESWISSFVWLSNEPEYLDLQYTPAVQIEDSVAVVASVAASSAYVRNALVACQERPWADNDELMIQHIKSAFDGVSDVKLWTGVEYDGDADGEVDCLVLLDGELFAFECKKTLLPCSAFERRTTTDCLREASEQLARFETFWSDSGHRSRLAVLLDCPDLQSAPLNCAIILSHRLYSGAQWDNRPIRQIGELWNFVSTGQGELQFSGARVPVQMRSTGRCSAVQLKEYLSFNAPHQTAIWRSMCRADEVLRLNSCTVKIPHYGLNWTKFLCELGVVPDRLRAQAEGIARLVEQRSRQGRLDDAREANLNAEGLEFERELLIHLAGTSGASP